MAGRWLWDWAFWTVAMWDFMRSMWTPAAGEKDWAVVSAARFSLRQKKKGAEHAYLQVVKGNVHAKHLYTTLGYEDFYTYWFRAKNVIGTQNEIS